MSENRLNLLETQRQSTERLLTGYPAPKRRVSNDQDPLEIHARELSLPIQKITPKEKAAIKKKIVRKAAGKIPEEEPSPFQKLKMNRQFNIYNDKKILFGLDKVFDTINTVDHELLVAHQKLRLQKMLLELKKVNYANMMKKGMKDIEDLSDQIKMEKREFKEQKLLLQQQQDDDMKKITENHHRLISFIETQIERQVRWRKFEWLPDTDAFNGQIEAFYDLLNYSREKFEGESSVKLKTLGKVLAASQRTVESYKINLAAMDSDFKKQVAELTGRIDSVTGKTSSVQLRNEEVERRLKAYQEERLNEENDLCEHFTYLYKEFVEKQEERLLVAKEKRDLMKQMAQESSNQVADAKKKVKQLRDAIIPPDITKPDIDELAAKARLRVGKIILKQLQQENLQLQEDLRISSTISSISNSSIPTAKMSVSPLSSISYSSSNSSPSKPKSKPIIKTSSSRTNTRSSSKFSSPKSKKTSSLYSSSSSDL